MPSKSESGHVKSIANFGTMIMILEAYGTMYNPSKQSLTIQHLKQTHLNAEQSISKLNKVMPAYKKAVSERMEAFEPLSKLMTRVKNAIILTDATQKLKDN